MAKEKKRGLRLALIGLTAGISLGLGIQLLKGFISRELINLLRDEVRASCDCEFNVDDVSISLLTFNAVAKNARIEREGIVKFQVNRIFADFNLTAILERRVLLDHLELQGAHSTGVLGSSETFQFIDHLTEPIPPEKDNPDRIKISLLALSLADGSFTQKIGNTTLKAEGVRMSVLKDNNDDFILLPHIDSLHLLIPPKNDEQVTDLKLGDVTARIHLRDGEADFQRVLLKLGDAFAEIDAIADLENNDALTGTIRYRLNSTFLKLPESLQVFLQGGGTMGGTLEHPAFSGTLSEQPDTLSHQSIAGEKIVELDHADGRVDFALTDENATVTIPTLSARGPSSAIALLSPLTLVDDQLSSEFSIRIGAFEIADATLSDVQATLTATGPLDDVVLRLSGSIGQLTWADRSLPEIAATVTYHDDALTIDLAHESSQNGLLNVNGIMSNIDSAPTINLSYQFEDLSLLNLPDETDLSPAAPIDASTGKMRLAGSGTVSGPLKTEELKASAKLIVSSPHFRGESALRGSATLSAGTLDINLFNHSRSLSSKITLDLTAARSGTASLELIDFRPKEYEPDLDCAEASLKATYQFALNSPQSGTGRVNMSELSFGCGENRLALDSATSLNIKDGMLAFDQLSFAGIDTALSVSGGLSFDSSLDLHAEGTLDLNALLPLLPAFDDLRGTLNAAVDIRGSLAKPKIYGAAALKAGELAIEAANISVVGAAGTIKISEEHIQLTNVEGAVNGGHVKVEGKIFPLNMKRSLLTAQLEDILVHPVEDSVLTFSGAIELATNEQNIPRITGEVIIDQAELERHFDLTSLLLKLREQVTRRSSSGGQFKDLPEIELDIEIEASRNVFIVTNWLGAELKGTISIEGQLASPRIGGELVTLGGWFGIRDRRFEITSGSIHFDPISGEAQVDIVSEALVRMRNGGAMLIILEATGPATSPKITLSSDSGHTEEEILQALSSGGSLRSETLAGSSSQDYRAMELRSLDEAEFSWRAFFRNVTKIDSIAIEPVFNARRGVVEPALTGQKVLTDSLTAIGQSFLEEQGQDARLMLQYDISSALRATAIIDTLGTEDNTALEANLASTILSNQKPYLEISTSGNRKVSEYEMLKAVRINRSSHLPFSELDKAARAIEEYLASQGYLDSSVQATCQVRGEHCAALRLDIIEGNQYRIDTVSISGDAIDPSINTSTIMASAEGSRASLRTLRRTQNSLIKRLRSEGYISARVRAAYKKVDGSDNKVTLHLIANPGRPVSFTFIGNNYFSDGDFLETIRLFSRKQPFGNNTVNILIENIERLYRESGFLFVTIKHERTVDTASGRINYTIAINEEQKIEVEKTSFEGNSALSDEQLTSLIDSQFGPDALLQIIAPEYIIAEELEDSILVLKEVYFEAGYPNVAAAYRISQGTDNSKANIIYQIREGAELRSNWLTIDSLPTGFVAPPLPRSDYSVPAANRYMSNLHRLLIEHGYLTPHLWTETIGARGEVRVHIDTGPQTHIADVVVSGNVDINSEFIINRSGLTAGAPWNLTQIRTAKRRLLTTGLFSRITISAQNETARDPARVLVIGVTERPLTTLELGGGVNSEFGLHLFGQATDKSVFKDGRALSLRFDTYYDDTAAEINQGVANLRYLDPEFLSTPFVFTEDLRFQRIELSTFEYDLDRLSLSTFFFRGWNNTTTMSIGHTALREDLDNVSPDSIIGSHDEGIVDLSFLTFGATFDRRDNPLNPTTGYNISLRTSVAGAAIGSDANYYSVVGGGSYLVPFHLGHSHLVLAANSRIGAAWTFSDTDAIPISQRFYLGGRNSVRGFRENSLGPRGASGSIIGGDMLTQANIEFRYLITDSFSMHTFIDAGTVFLKDESTSLSRIRESAGYGLRYLSPLGPIGFDIGHPLDERPGEPSTRFHFNIGFSF